MFKFSINLTCDSCLFCVEGKCLKQSADRTNGFEYCYSPRTYKHKLDSFKIISETFQDKIQTGIIEIPKEKEKEKSMSNFSIEDKKKFVELVEPLQRRLKKFHPHISVIVNNQTAEILEGICAFDNSISGGVDMAFGESKTILSIHNKSDNRDMLDSLYLVLSRIRIIPNKTTERKDEKIAVFLL